MKKIDATSTLIKVWSEAIKIFQKSQENDATSRLITLILKWYFQNKTWSEAIKIFQKCKENDATS